MATSWLERMGKTAFLRFLKHSPFSFSTDKVKVLNNCPHVYPEGPGLRGTCARPNISSKSLSLSAVSIKQQCFMCFFFCFSPGSALHVPTAQSASSTVL